MVLSLPEGQLDQPRLRQLLGVAADVATFVVEDAGCASNVTLAKSSPAVAPGVAPAAPQLTLNVTTQRRPVQATPESSEPAPPALTHDRLSAALADAMANDASATVAAFVSLVYPAASTKWRFPLLATPPTITEPQSDLGRISLTGVNLSFSESPTGLRLATLSSMPGGESLAVNLVYVILYKSDAVRSLFQQVLDSAEKWAALFVEPGSPEAASTAAKG